MRLALAGLNPQDTFNLITFSGDTRILFPEPVPATQENLRKAREFLDSHSGSGGTEMMKAIRAALDPSDSQSHIRVVCFMTDGYVGNDMEIIAEIQKHPNARIFSFGIGNSANRFLLDKMAEYGRGEVEYVSLSEDGSAAARRFHERVRNPLLTDISIDWGGLPVGEIYPARIPDLFSAKPLILTGRYSRSARGTIRLRGKVAGREFTRNIAVTLPETEPRHDVLSSLWARTQIDHLMGQDYAGIQRGTTRGDVREAITKLGLEYRLMTQFTSFVAVEEVVVTEGGTPRRIDVPVEMPEGVSYEGVFGERKEVMAFASQAGAAKLQTSAAARVRPAMVAQEMADRSTTTVPPQKLDSFLAALANRLKNGTALRPEEAAAVSNGKIAIQIWLSDASPNAIAKLKRLGFEVVYGPGAGKLLVGRLPVEKLTTLAEMSEIRYVSRYLSAGK
jgi:Ca-activated chloride channel family protein